MTVGIGVAYTKIYDSQMLGLLIGSLVAFVGNLLGSIITYIISSYVLRSYVQKHAKKSLKLQAFDKAT